MTYDPRAGASPYLGMDDYDELDQDGLMVDVEDDLEIEDPFSQDGTMAMDPNQVPKTVRRSFEPPRRGVAPRDQGTSPLGTGPIIRRPAAQETGPAPRVSQDTTVHAATVVDYDEAPSRRMHFEDALFSFALLMAHLFFCLAAIALAVIFVIAAIPTDATRLLLLRLTNLLPMVVPSALLGQYVVETPFGGILRGDLAIASIILFIADWLCAKKRSSLLRRRERGE
jgi:hypothetical protein